MWQLSAYAVTRLREELTRLAQQAHPQADDVAIREAVSLLMDDGSVPVSVAAQTIAQALLDWAYDPSNPDADLLLIHRRSNGLDRDPWSPALAARVMTGLKLLTGCRPGRRR